MRIHILRQTPTTQQLEEMLEAQGDFIKLAVDQRRRVLAGGGEMHADCEVALLDDGVSRRMCGAQIGFPTNGRCVMNRSSTSGRAKATVR
jgi:hypothetical protein